jgi:hypothetical protein
LAAFSESSSTLGAVGTGALCLAYGVALLKRHLAARWLGPALAILFTLGTVSSGFVPILALLDVALLVFVSYVHVHRDVLLPQTHDSAGESHATDVKGIRRLALVIVSAAIGAFGTFAVMRSNPQADYHEWLRDLRMTREGQSKSGPSSSDFDPTILVDEIKGQQREDRQVFISLEPLWVTVGGFPLRDGHFDDDLKGAERLTAGAKQLMTAAGIKVVAGAKGNANTITFDIQRGDYDANSTVTVVASVTVPAHLSAFPNIERNVQVWNSVSRTAACPPSEVNGVALTLIGELVNKFVQDRSSWLNAHD